MLQLLEKVRSWFGRPKVAPPLPALVPEVVAVEHDAERLIVSEEPTLSIHEPATDDGTQEIDAGDEELVIAESFISFDADELAVIDRLRPLLLDRALSELPAPTAFPDRAARALSRRSFEFEELVKLGHTDVAIAAALLRIANSSLFAGTRGVEEIQQAVARLGTDLSTNIVTGIAAQSLFDVSTRAEHEVFANAFRDLFRQSMTAALVATRLSDRLRIGRSSLAFSAGLFHDIGKVVALRALAQLVLKGQAPRDLSQNVVVRLVEDVHVTVGIAMLRKWSLPATLVDLCAHHHDPEVAPHADRAIVHVVRVVSGLNALRIDRARYGCVVPEVQQSAEALGLTMPELGRVHGDLRRTDEQLQAMF